VTAAIERAAREEKDFELEYRLVMPDGFVKHVQVIAHAVSDASGPVEFVVRSWTSPNTAGRLPPWPARNGCSR